MSSTGVDLILKDITDKYVRENFFRLNNFLRDQVFFEGNFEFFEVDIKAQDLNFRVQHSLKFIPQDIFFLAVEGDHNFYFKYQNFDRDFIYISANGPCIIRFIAGRLSDKGRNALKARYPFVAPSAGAMGAVTSITSLSSYLTIINPTGPAVQINFTPPTSIPKLVETFTTDVGTAVRDLVRVNGSNTVTKINDNLAATIPNGAFGVVINKPNPTTAEVLFTGIITGYAGFTTGSPLFISTGGIPTHTVPTTGVVQQIGFAVNTTDFFVHLMLPTVRS